MSFSIKAIIRAFVAPKHRLACTINQMSGRTTSRFQTDHKFSKSDKKYPRYYITDDENITSMRFLCFNRHIGLDDVYR